MLRLQSAVQMVRTGVAGFVRCLFYGSSQSPAISSSSLSVVTVCDFRKGVLRSRVVDTL